MTEPKIIHWLRSLSIDEVKQFRRDFPLYCESEDARKLLPVLMLMVQEGKAVKSRKEEIYRKTFGRKVYDDQKWRHLLFLINQAMEDFLVSKRLLRDKNLIALSLLEEMSERKLTKLFDKQFESMDRSLDEEKQRDAPYYYYKFRINQSFNKYIKSKQIRSIEPNIQKLSDQLDLFYIINKIRIYNEALNYRNIVKIDYKIRFMDRILPELEQNPFEEVPVLDALRSGMNTLLNPDEESHFAILKNILDQHAESIGRETLQDLHTLARNYCIKKVNGGNTQYLRELFDLYKSELIVMKSETLKEISPATYKNIVSTAFSLEEIDWALEFINTYTSSLPEDMRVPYYNYNLARYCFVKKDFKKVIDSLLKVEYSELFLMLSAKALLLKTYFELKEYSAMDSLSASFKELLRHKEILGYHRRNYSNFLKYLNKIIKIDKRDKVKAAALREQIRLSREIIDKSWLLSKL